MRSTLVLRHFWGRGGPWNHKWAENMAHMKNFYGPHGQKWDGHYRYYWHHHQRKPKRMVLGFLAGIAVGYVACANYPPRWMNMDYVRERKCWREKWAQHHQHGPWGPMAQATNQGQNPGQFPENDFTTKIINPEFVQNYDPDTGLVTIKLPEPVREKFKQFARRGEWGGWGSSSKTE